MRRDDFDPSVVLPNGLTVAAVRSAVDFIERDMDGLVEIYFEQSNMFSGLVSIWGTKALDMHSVYEKNRNRDVAAGKFPDLQRRGSPTPPPPQDCLESKASIRPWQIQAHFDHPGWYIVWRYLIDTTNTYERDRQVIIWRVDVAFLNRDDWKYERSTSGPHGGGRTETWGLIKPATKLRGKAVYARSDVAIKGGKPVPANGPTTGGTA
ncbi:MAG: hypothetical protein F4Y12_03800 [Acidimicrobiaceae bacterium]|nr:hypothetical protein [Acidimicrobiaceae bacterium]MYH78635.1 hypothetical protein [Acidimicrobiaceae bacterium]MYK66520.1 hypothetical protein [Gemmatimonadota bacterium]